MSMRSFLMFNNTSHKNNRSEIDTISKKRKKVLCIKKKVLTLQSKVENCFH